MWSTQHPKPQELRFRKLNIAKVTPKLTACGLGPVYLIQHAGFRQGEQHFELQPELGTDSAQVVLLLIQE